MPQMPTRAVDTGKDGRPGRQAFGGFRLFDGHHGQVHLDGRADGVADGVDGPVDAREVVARRGNTPASPYTSGTRPPCSLPATSSNGPAAWRSTVVRRLRAYSRSMLPRGAMVKDLLLDGLQFRLRSRRSSEIAVHHRVHQGIQHEAGAVAQQQRLALAAPAHAQESCLLRRRTEST